MAEHSYEFVYISSLAILIRCSRWRGPSPRSWFVERYFVASLSRELRLFATGARVDLDQPRIDVEKAAGPEEGVLTFVWVA